MIWLEVELNESYLNEDMTELFAMTRIVEEKLKSVLNVSSKVKLVLPGTLARFEGKSTHVTDKRRYDR